MTGVQTCALPICAAFIVKTARKEGLTLKQAALKLGFLTEEQFDKAIEKATQPQ